MIDKETLRHELERAMEWIGLEWHDAPFKNLLAQRYLVTSDQSGQPMKANQYKTFSPQDRADLEQHRLDQWYQWSESQRQTFRQLCGQSMSNMGYSIP